MLAYCSVIMFINCLVISCLGFTSNYNNIEVIELLAAPMHICPEWYFLHLYLMLKVQPNKINGWLGIILLVLSWVILLVNKNNTNNILLVSYISTTTNMFIIFNICLLVVIMHIGMALITSIMVSYGRLYLLVYLFILTL